MTTVVFDVGNVLIDWDAKRVYRDYFDSEAEIEEFFAEIGFYTWNLQLDRGGTFAEAVADHSARHPERAELIARFDRHWHLSVPGAIDGTVDLLHQLHDAGVPLYAITNFSREKWSECQDRFSFLRSRFRDVVVSAHENLVKPDPAIFELFLDRHELPAESCIFIDDSPANVEGARAIGMHAVHFTTPERLKADLRDTGLL